MKSFFLANNNRLNLKGAPKFYAFGDSITANNTAYGFCNQLATYFGITKMQNAVASEGFPLMTKKVNQNFDNTGMSLSATGRNDYQKTYLPEFGNLVTALMLGIQFSDSIIAANSGTQVGAWSSVDKTALCSKSTACMETSASGATLTFNVTGKSFVVAMLGSDTTNSTGTFSIYADDVLVQTVNPTVSCFTSTLGGTNYQEVGLGIPVMFATTGAHTIKVTRDSGTIIVDYISKLKTPDTCFPSVISSAFVTGDVISYPARMASLVSNLKSCVSKFKNAGYPVSFIDMARFWTNDETQNPGPDYIHPDQLAHNCFANAFISQFK